MLLKRLKKSGLIILSISFMLSVTLSTLGNENMDEKYNRDDSFISDAEDNTFEPTIEEDVEIPAGIGSVGISTLSSDVPKFGDFVGTGGTVNLFLTSKATSAYTYVTGNYSSGVFPILDHENGRYKIMISGLVAWVNDGNVKNITPYSDTLNVNYYTVTNNEIVHRVSYGIKDNRTSSIIQGLNDGNYELQANKKYLSYDGQFFYEKSPSGAKKMFTDYNKINNLNNNQLDIYTGSVNPKDPYYNYFMWQPLRTQTKLTAQDMRNYLVSNGYKSPSASRLYEMEQLFLDNGNHYGDNAAIGFATAIHESAFGSSKYSKSRNNSFGHAAVDSNPDLANTYPSQGYGMEEHFSWYFNTRYGPRDGMFYNGGSVGNKDLGMNVKYASDAYWGEKIAQHYYRMDKMAGYKDYRRYTIGVVTHSGIGVKKTASASAANSYTTRYSGVPISITSQSGNYYGFLSESVLDANKNIVNMNILSNTYSRYNISNSTVYIPKSNVRIVSQGKDSKLLSQPNVTLPKAPKLESKSRTLYTLNNLHLRPDWSTKYTHMSTIPKDTKITGYVTDNGWVRVTYGDYLGYVSAEFVSESKGGKPINPPTNGGGGGNETEKPEVPDKPKPDFIKGDVNGDNKLNSTDYMIIKNYIMGKRKLNSTELKRADANSDGKVNSLDYMRIKNIILGR